MDYPNWFAVTAQANFEQFLLPDAGKPDLAYLQLGVFTGDATKWLCETVLTGDDCYILDIDTWQGAENEPIQEQMDFEDVFATYFEKVKPFKQVGYFRDTTQKFLLSMSKDKELYDFIYVDAHHTAASAFLDCELSWPLLKQGGMMAIDDYEWTHPDGLDIHAPKLGIAMFLDRHKEEVEVLAINSQAWLKKR